MASLYSTPAAHHLLLHTVCAPKHSSPYPDLKLHTMRSATVVLAALVALQLLTPAASGTSCAAPGSGGPCGWPNKAVTHPKRLLLPAADLKDAITWPLDQSSLDAYCAGVCRANGTTFDYSSKTERLAAPWMHRLSRACMSLRCGRSPRAAGNAPALAAGAVYYYFGNQDTHDGLYMLKCGCQSSQSTVDTAFSLAYLGQAPARPPLPSPTLLVRVHPPAMCRFLAVRSAIAAGKASPNMACMS